MSKKKSLLKNMPFNVIAAGVAIIQYIITFFTDRFYFDYWPIGESDFKRLFIYKALLLVVLFAVWQLIFRLVDSIKNKTVNRTWLMCSVAYFTVLLVSTFAVWPGFWEWDEFYILSANVNLHMHIWQSFLSNVIYTLSLMIIPFPTGVVLVQIVIVSVITGYVLSFLFDELKCSLLGKIILWIPFFLCPVLYFAQAPIRMGLYSFLELTQVVLLYKLYRNRSWSIAEAIISVILIPVISTWRTEGIYYFVPACILIWLFMDKKVESSTTLIVLIVILTIVLYVMQAYCYKQRTEDQYEITAYINQVEELVGYASANGDADDPEISDLIVEIGRVFDMEVLINSYNSGGTGISAFWGGQSVKQHTEDDLKAMKKAYVGLIKKYPMVFLKERLRVYWHSDMIICSTLGLYEDERDMVVNFRESYNLTGSINPAVRAATVNFIEMNNSKLRKYLYHSFFPQMVLLLVAVICMLKKVWGGAWIMLLTLVRVPLVFVTAPERYFMYYFPTYLVGMVVFTCVIVRFICMHQVRE